MRYVKGLREDAAQEIVRQRALRPFRSIDDLKLRVPALQKSELTALAEIGALNFIESSGSCRAKCGVGKSEKSPLASSRRPLASGTRGAQRGPLAPGMHELGSIRKLCQMPDGPGRLTSAAHDCRGKARRGFSRYGNDGWASPHGLSSPGTAKRKAFAPPWSFATFPMALPCASPAA